MQTTIDNQRMIKKQLSMNPFVKTNTSLKRQFQITPFLRRTVLFDENYLWIIDSIKVSTGRCFDVHDVRKTLS